MNATDSELKALLHSALEEDCPHRDITTDLCVSPASTSTARIIAKESGIFYGTEIIDAIFELLNPKTHITHHLQNASPAEKGDCIAIINGYTADILKAERVMLNLLQHLSGVASITNEFVKKLNNSHIKIMDTRKTTAKLRFLERKAVIAGGGQNHRLNLSDQVLIKENHLTALKEEGNLAQLPTRLQQFKKANPKIKIEIEIEHPSDLALLPLDHIDIILCDNFTLSQLRVAVAEIRDKKSQIDIEVSGNISLETISLYNQEDIDRISIGRLTHSVKALDLSLLIDRTQNA